MELFNLSWLAIIAASICGFVVGGIWYGPSWVKNGWAR
jgi:hypothetical protein